MTETGVTVQKSFSFWAYPGNVIASLEHGLFTLTPAFFGKKFPPVISVAVTHIERVSFIKQGRLKNTLIEISANHQLIRFSSRKMPGWVDEFARNNIPIYNKELANEVDIPGRVERATMTAMSIIGSAFALLCLGLLILFGSLAFWSYIRHHF